MKERERNTALRFGIMDQCEKLEQELLTIPGATEVDFDLSGFYDRMYYVIALVGYDIDVRRPDYFEARRLFVQSVVDIMRKHDLYPSGDAIEDYGEHYYFVRECGSSWKHTKEEG